MTRIPEALAKVCGDTMKDFVRSAVQWLADTRLARRVVDTLFRGKARRRLRELDQESVARSQNRTLLGLIHKAHTTRFGREHDFRRIRDAADFRRLVPLRTPADLWREYWQPVYPHLAGATWPGPIPYLAISSAQNASLPYVPVSPALWAVQQTAALTALAFILHARPRLRFYTGRLCLVGSGATLFPAGNPATAESLEAVALRNLPLHLQPYASACATAGERPVEQLHDQLLEELAGRSMALPVTCLAGTADRLTRFLGHVKRVTGHDRVADVWPQLAAILYTRHTPGPERVQLLEEIGSTDICCLEMFLRPEGAIAIEDPRHTGLRLLPDHGVYYEFVPVEQVGDPRPQRISASEVKIGVPYALALSSPAGVWACLVGNVVQFESLHPPLLQLVEAGDLWERAAVPVSVPAKQITPAHDFPTQPPHRRSVGTPATHPETFFRTLSSARAGRE